MKEFFYTACPTGKRADDRRPTIGGFGARAMSVGLEKARLDAALRVANCDFPFKMPRQPVGAITRLALLRPADGRLLLLHSVPGGADEANRNGIPFTHALVELPDDVGAERAILAWGSTGWRRSYDDDALDLPGPAVWPPPGPLSARGLAAFLQDTNNRAMTTYALAALLALPSQPQAKLYLYAEPEQVAWVVFALTLSLPHPARDELTFSTYEKGVLDVPARLVGTFAQPLDNDLPRGCYASGCAAFNRESGRTGPPFASLYATAAVAWLAEDLPDRPKQFLELARSLQVEDGAALDDLLVLESTPETLAADQVRRLLSRQPTDSRLVSNSAALDRSLVLALESGDPNGDLLTLLVRASGSGTVRETIAARVEQAAVDAARADRPKPLNDHLSLLRGIDPERANAFAPLALRSLTPAALSWLTRRALLVLFRDDRPADRVALRPELRPWLDVDTVDMPDLLTLKLPDAWETFAWARAALRFQPADLALAARLAQQPARLAAVYRLLEAETGAEPDVLLAAAIEAAPLKELLTAFEKDAGPVPSRLVDRILADRAVARSQLARPAVLRRLSERPEALAQLIGWGLENSDVSHLLDKSVLQAIGPDAMVGALADAGWNALRAGAVARAEFAWNHVLPTLGPTRRTPRQLEPPAGFRPGDVARGAQAFLVKYLLAAGDEARLIAWLPELSAEVVSSLLIESTARFSIKAEAFRQYVVRHRQLPPEAGQIAGPLESIVELFVWLGSHSHEVGHNYAPALADTLLQHQPGLEDRLRQALLRLAEGAPSFWPAVDRLLAYGIGKGPSGLPSEVRDAATLLVEQHGCTGTVHALADRILSARSLDPAAWPFLTAIESCSRRPNPPGGPPRADLLALIRYETLAERLGGDMGQWHNLLSLIPPLDARYRERKLVEQLEFVGRELLGQPASSQLPAWLDDRVNDLTATLFHAKADALDRLVRHVGGTSALGPDFWANPKAVSACFAVGLGVTGAGTRAGQGARAGSREVWGNAGRSGSPRPDTKMTPVLQWLADEAWRHGGDALFLDLARCAGGGSWPDDSFAEWKRYYARAKDGPASSTEPSKPGLFGRLLGGGNR